MKRVLLVSLGLIAMASYAGCLPEEGDATGTRCNGTGSSPQGVGGQHGRTGNNGGHPGSAGTTGRRVGSEQHRGHRWFDVDGRHGRFDGHRGHGRRGRRHRRRGGGTGGAVGGTGGAVGGTGGGSTGRGGAAAARADRRRARGGATWRHHRHGRRPGGRAVALPRFRQSPSCSRSGTTARSTAGS